MDITFKDERSRSRSPGRFTHRGVYTSGSCSGDRGNVFTVETYRYVVARHGRLGGASALRRPEREKRAGLIVAAPAQLVLNIFNKN